MMKNATIAPTIKTETTIPAMTPAPIPDLLPALDDPPVPPELLFLLGLLAGGAPGGGGGAGPVFQELPFELLSEAQSAHITPSSHEHNYISKYIHYGMLTASLCLSTALVSIH